MLSLLPGDPVRLARPLGRDGRAGEPALDRGAELGLAPEPDDERDVVELDVEPPPQLREAAEELQVVLAVAPVSRRRSARAPRALWTRGSEASAATSRFGPAAWLTVQVCNGRNLTTTLSSLASCGSRARSSPRVRSGPRGGRRRRGGASRPRRSACPRSPSRGGRCPAGSGTRRPRRSRASRARRRSRRARARRGPRWTSQDSSFTSWYWRLSDCPARTNSSLPT